MLVGQLIFKFIRWSVSLISQVIFQLRLPGTDLIFQFFSPTFSVQKFRSACFVRLLSTSKEGNDEMNALDPEGNLFLEILVYE